MRRLAEVAGWAVVGTALWLLTLSSVNLPEVVLAVAASLVCGVLAVAARRAVQGAWPLQAGWARWLLPLPVATLADGGRLLWLAWTVLRGRRIPDGEVGTVPLPRDRTAGRRSSRQAAGVLLVTATPGTVVLDVDETSGCLLVHRLGAGRPSMEEVVSR